jgi:predicted nucleotidyltransferase
MRSLAKDAVLEILRPCLSERPEIHFAYLFGSLAKGTQNRLSDVDVAVFLDPEFLARPHAEHSYGYKAHLITELMSHLRTNQIDVVILNHASPFLRFQVLRDGIVICETNREERIQFQAQALSRYFDLKPFLEASLPAKVFG